MKTVFSLLTFLFLCASLEAQTDSIKSTTQPFQMSFIPPMSTNGIANQNSTNHLSINIVAGYSGGLEGIEMGGLANVIKQDAKGVQLSGFTNVVGGKVEGVQLSGFANINKGSTRGIQMAGFINMVNDSSSGIQSSGFANINNGSFSGWQNAGFVNLNQGKLQGVQTAGFTNVTADSIDGVQASGFYNQTNGSINGVQAAGFMNLCNETLEGIQASGFLNVTKRLRGLQIGFLNIADTLEKGTPIGFLSFIRKGGFKAVEITANETFPMGIQLKTGSDIFYNIFTLSAKTGKDFYWAWGTGFGSNLKSKGKFRINLDFTAMHVNDGTVYTDHLNLHGKTQLGFTWQAAKHFAISAGPSFNCLVVNKMNSEGIQNDASVAPYSVLDKMYNDTRVVLWPGAFVSVRF
jgi:hypothetical protein